MTSSTTSRSKTKAKPKKKKVRLHTREEALREIQLYARLSRADSRGYVHCISCGKPMKWNEAQGGHYIAKGYGYATAHLIENIHPQCYACNVCKSGYVHRYRANLVDQYGEAFVRRLEDIDAAYYGDDDAYRRLSRTDKALARDGFGKKVKYSKGYWDEAYRLYKSKNEEIKRGLPND